MTTTAIVRAVIILASTALLAGCTSRHMGSKTVVGSHFALPKLVSEPTSTDLEIYESTEGAVVTTRRDCRVRIEYANHYTNDCLGVWRKLGAMRLTVDIEPLAVADDAADGDAD